MVSIDWLPNLFSVSEMRHKSRAYHLHNKAMAIKGVWYNKLYHLCKWVCTCPWVKQKRAKTAPLGVSFASQQLNSHHSTILVIIRLPGTICFFLNINVYGWKRIRTCFSFSHVLCSDLWTIKECDEAGPCYFGSPPPPEFYKFLTFTWLSTTDN